MIYLLMVARSRVDMLRSRLRTPVPRPFDAPIVRQNLVEPLARLGMSPDLPGEQFTSTSANLNMLRAVAVLLVVQAHVFLYFGNPFVALLEPSLLGRLGVLFFFVHTSLVLLCALDRQELRYGPARRFRIFMLRRLFRILPLSALAVTLIFIFNLPLGRIETRSLTAADNDLANFVLNLLLVQDFGGQSLLGPLWSLPYEVQMYLLLPAIAVALRRVTTADVVLIVWGVAMLLLVVMQPRIDQLNVRLDPVQVPDWLLYAPCFLPGVLAYKLAGQRARTLPFTWFVTLIAALCLVYMASYNLLKFPLVCLVLGLALPHFRELSAGRLASSAAIIARYSYGLYLFHYFSLWLAFERLADQPMLLQWGMFLATLAAVPVFLYHALEAPMIRLGNRVVERWVGTATVTAPTMLTPVTSG